METLAMIYTQPTSNERMKMRYTIARLESLRNQLSAVRIKMEQIALETKDKSLRGNLLNFVTETGPCEEEVKRYEESLLQVFPVQDLSPVQKDMNDTYTTECPFDCAKDYEHKIIKSFRAIINDHNVMPEIRQPMRTQLNEILYAFLKVKMLRDFSNKELKADTYLF